jgi:peptidoglycan lytic transglycosylase G
MNSDPRTRWEDEDRRNERIRELRAQRGSGDQRPRRPFQPLILLAWIAGVAALAAILIFVGFLAFAPRLMDWVEANPTMIKQGIVLDFVRWYDPHVLDDTAVGSDGGRITFTIDTGQTDAQIGHNLYLSGLVRSELAFQYWVNQAGRQGDLQAGTYDLSPSLTPSEIVAALRQEAGPEITIRIQEGWRLEQIVGYLSTTKLTMNLSEFVQLVENPPADLLNQYDFFKDLPAGRTLEGYLFPDTYRVNTNASARQVVEKMLNDFETRVTPEIQAAIAKQKVNGKPMTLDQAVILASIVEREAVLDSERPTIAGVYLNRLNTKGWVLNADPTLQYGLATAEYADATVGAWHTIDWWAPLPSAGADVKLPKDLSGYQTYINAGLPPSPISAPRLASIEAVANADTKAGYFFFVAACPNGVRDGSHYFAKTLAQHNANVAKASAECPAS